MKFTKWILGLSLISVLAVQTCQAQLDVFKSTRTLVVQQPVVLSGAALTNASVDLVGFFGYVKLDLCVNTNGGSGDSAAAGAGTLTATILSSNDTNTWTLVPYAQALATSLSYTNYPLGTNAVFTDTFLMPGTNTYPTAATAGFATPYLASIPMTNTTAISIKGTAVYSVGFNATDAGRYLQVAWAATNDKTTNAVVSAVLTGVRAF